MKENDAAVCSLEARWTHADWAARFVMVSRDGVLEELRDYAAGEAGWHQIEGEKNNSIEHACQVFLQDAFDWTLMDKPIISHLARGYVGQL